VGALRILTFVAILFAGFLFGVTAGLFVEQLHPREEATSSAVPVQELLPADRLSKDQIKVYSDHVRIDIAGARWASFTPTGSMLPVLGSTAHALQVIPRNPEDIKVGDIISFHADGAIISHRVIEVGEDETGAYYVTQGDNNPGADPLRVRFEQVDRVVIGILY
jgi:hypothetical protein